MVHGGTAKIWVWLNRERKPVAGWVKPFAQRGGSYFSEVREREKGSCARACSPGGRNSRSHFEGTGTGRGKLRWEMGSLCTAAPLGPREDRDLAESLNLNPLTL